MAEIVSRAAYDWRRLGLVLRREIELRNVPLRRLGDMIGVTATDLSRASSGTSVSVEKVFAICDWLGAEPRDFYLPPIKSKRCTSHHVKHREARP